jgi:uncharacterized protein YndB with AHSA1/START domain
MSTETETTIDRETCTITFHRRFEAPCEEVFDAWTKPEQIAAWWDPTGAPLARCVVDLRPGGAFSFENQGHSPPFAGVYEVVERPSKLVFGALGSMGTVELEREGDLTSMRVQIRCASPEHMEQFLKLGVDVNTDRTLDNLVARFA